MYNFFQQDETSLFLCIFISIGHSLFCCCRGTSETDARGQLLKLINLLEFYGMVFFDVRVSNLNL